MVARRAHAPKRRYRSVQFVCHSEIDREGMYTESARHSSWAEDAKYDFVVKLVQAQQGSCKWRYPIRKNVLFVTSHRTFLLNLEFIRQFPSHAPPRWH